MKKQKKEKSVIELKKVYKSYFPSDEVEVKVLFDINLEVKKDDFVVIIGPSGSGKSTMMNIVGVLDVPTNGSLLIDDVDVSTYSENELAAIRRNKVGFIFQQFNLISILSARDNVTLPMIFKNIDEDTRKKRAKQLLTFVGLGHRIDHKPTEMSGGEQQRVAIARSLANDPEIILADEPTGNLDTKSGKVIIELLEKLHSEGKTIIMITHDERFVQKGRRIVKIKDGRIEKDYYCSSKSCQQALKINGKK